jgi:hypothetical protein
MLVKIDAFEVVVCIVVVCIVVVCIVVVCIVVVCIVVVCVVVENSESNTLRSPISKVN